MGDKQQSRCVLSCSNLPCALCPTFKHNTTLAKLSTPTKQVSSVLHASVFAVFRLELLTQHVALAHTIVHKGLYMDKPAPSVLERQPAQLQFQWAVYYAGSGNVGVRLIDLGNCFSLNGTDTSRISFEMQTLSFRAPEVMHVLTHPLRHISSLTVLLTCLLARWLSCTH